MQISLAPDWAPSGSKSVLGELKVADLVNRQALQGFSAIRNWCAWSLAILRRPWAGNAWPARFRPDMWRTWW